MKHFAIFGLVLLAGAAQAQTGHWQGKIAIPEHELGVSLDLAQNAKGAWIGSITIVGTTAVDVPLTMVAVDGAAVRFTASFPDQASFEGQVSTDGGEISGTATNAQGQAPFHLARSGEANVKVPPPSSALSKEFEGTWQGTLEAGGRIVHVALKLSVAPDGTALGTLIAVDQGNQQIPVATVTIAGKDLQLEARVVSGIYKGTLGESGEIAGQWNQGQMSTPLNFKRAPAEEKKP